MEQRHKALLLAKRLEITSDLRFRDIRRHLVDNRILNGTDLDEIENEETREDQAKTLLDILPTRGTNAFMVFRDALKDRYPHLARILQDEGRHNLPTDSGIKEPRVFIIHAGEDKESFVRPLVANLQQQGLAEKDIFFDDVSIKPGDVIRDRILSTLSSESLELAVIVVSTSFLKKPYWPKLEFETCLRNKKRIFPIWVDSNDDNFKVFSKLVGEYSPTLKQMSAKRVQEGDVADELPNIATEVVQRLSTLKSVVPEPTAIQTLLCLAPHPSPSDSDSSDQGSRATKANDEQWIEDRLKDEKAKLELLGKLGVMQLQLLKEAEGLLSAEKIERKTEEMLDNLYQSGLHLVKVTNGCVILHLVPDNVTTLDSFWGDYNTGLLSIHFSDCLLTDEMRTVVGKDLMVRVIMLDEQYQQWKEYFHETVDMEAIQGAALESEEGDITAGLQALSIGLLGRQMTTPGHLVLNLSRESFGSVMHAEEFNAFRLSDKTGAQVAIRRRMFRDTVGLILEAWGDQEALRRVEEEVEQMEMKSKHLVPSLNFRQSYVEGGHVVLFEGLTSPQDKVRLQPYHGERNPDQDRKTLVSPYLLQTAPYNTREDGADFDLFLKTLQRQGKCVNDEHDESMHGELRAIARYGNVYMYNTSHVTPTMTVEEFDHDLNKGHRTADDYFSGVSADSRGSYGRRGRGRGRGRGGRGRGWVNDPLTKFMRHSFIPSAATSDVLQKFMETFNFEEFTSTEKYNVSCRFERRVENTIILDKDLKFLEFRLSDVKWMALDLKRRPRSDTHPYGTDIRFKLQSRRILRGDEVEKSDEYQKFLDPDLKVLEQGHSYGLRGLHGEANLQIHPDYRGKVHFARRKLIRRFRAADDVLHSRFRTGVKVRLTDVCEYSRPDSSGRFTSVKSRQEVTVIPPLPDWTSPEEVETFAREYWQFCLELGDTLYP